MSVNWDEPIELYNTQTGEVREAQFVVWQGNVALVRPAVESGWANYRSDGSALMGDRNPWMIRNKVDVNLENLVLTINEMGWNLGFAQKDNFNGWSVEARQGHRTSYDAVLLADELHLIDALLIIIQKIKNVEKVETLAKELGVKIKLS